MIAFVFGVIAASILDGSMHLVTGSQSTNTAVAPAIQIASAVAKNVYVGTNSGWFSCRTACYLAAGRPAVVQDTKWSRYVPSGNGVIAFDTMDETLAALAEVHGNWQHHSRAAYDVAREYLAPDKVLPPMIDAIHLSKDRDRSVPTPLPPGK